MAAPGLWITSAALLLVLCPVGYSQEDYPVYEQSFGIYSEGISCYVCDSTSTRLAESCNDRGRARGGNGNQPPWKLEHGCKACIKQHTFVSGTQYVKRECEKSLRFEFINECYGDVYVFGEAGEKCTCLTDSCNHGNVKTVSLSVSLLCCGSVLLRWWMS